jgi:tRNA threonylcarbamoyl adenosine modification protein (Sua5/YciO/YrdC/YwlC family)
MSDAIADAIAAAQRGSLIVFPTDTVYGIATRPDDPAATARLFDAKQRPRDLTVPVLASSTAVARRIARFDERAERLAFSLWPGAVTLVLPRSAVSQDWDLGGDRETIGVRVPDHAIALAVLAGGPLATTSANRSGEPPATTCEELASAFADDVDIYLCADQPLVGVASTVVSLVGDVEVLRVGSVDPETIVRLSAEEGPLLDSGPPR